MKLPWLACSLLPTPMFSQQAQTPPGHLVQLPNGHKMFLECSGDPNATPIVILASGRGLGTAESWAQQQVDGLNSEWHNFQVDLASRRASTLSGGGWLRRLGGVEGARTICHFTTGSSGLAPIYVGCRTYQPN